MISWWHWSNVGADDNEVTIWLAAVMWDLCSMHNMTDNRLITHPPWIGQYRLTLLTINLYHTDRVTCILICTNMMLHGNTMKYKHKYKYKCKYKYRLTINLRVTDQMTWILICSILAVSLHRLTTHLMWYSNTTKYKDKNKCKYKYKLTIKVCCTERISWIQK